jgi:hypothetical protein
MIMNKREFSKLIKQEIRSIVAKSRPNTLFEQAFFDLREKAKGLKTEWENDAGAKLENSVVSDLRTKGAKVIDAKLSLGKYRGSGFVTSFKLKIKVKDQAEADKVAEYLRGKYSPKWKVKKISEDGIADLNVR